jgi:hypothetical protein
MARESADIPYSMRKVYRRFERWRSATQPACRFRSAWRKMGDSGRSGADGRPAGVLRQKNRFARSRSAPRQRSRPSQAETRGAKYELKKANYAGQGGAGFKCVWNRKRDRKRAKF